MQLFIISWIAGFLITYTWGSIKHGPLVWWAAPAIFLSWPIGLFALIFDR